MSAPNITKAKRRHWRWEAAMNWRQHKPLATFIAVIAAVLAWQGISYLRDPNGVSVNEMSWVEPVELASGQTIKVKRSIHFTQRTAIAMGMMGQEYRGAALEIDPAPHDFVPWSAPILPIYLDRDPENGEWVVVGIAGVAEFWDWNGMPCPPQWGFRLHQGVWYVQPLPANLIGREPNLLADLSRTDDRDYSSDKFAAVAVARKRLQVATLRVPGIKRNLGDIDTGAFPTCNKPGPPRFTADLQDKGPYGLANFPRAPQ
jgi:hypothetical protein